MNSYALSQFHHHPSLTRSCLYCSCFCLLRCLGGGDLFHDIRSNSLHSCVSNDSFSMSWCFCWGPGACSYLLTLVLFIMAAMVYIQITITTIDYWFTGGAWFFIILVILVPMIRILRYALLFYDFVSASSFQFLLWHRICSADFGCSDLFFILFFIYFSVLCFWVHCHSTMPVDLDVRNGHDVVLLPLNAAAFCNEAFASNALKMTGLCQTTIVPKSIHDAVGQGFRVRVLTRDEHTVKVPFPGGGLTSLARMRMFCHFLNECVGVPCSVELFPPLSNGSCFANFKPDEDGASVIIYVLECEEDVIHFLTDVASKLLDRFSPPCVIVTHACLLNCQATPPHRDRLRDFICLIFGDKNGVGQFSPYDGLARALLDNVGSKVGSAMAAYVTSSPPCCVGIDVAWLCHTPFFLRFLPWRASHTGMRRNQLTRSLQALTSCQ
jgi:hypothetical protein